jgi:hypothetical protein
MGSPGPSPLNLLITLQLSNQSELDTLLVQLSDSSSAQYHRYLSAAQFDARFSPAVATWSGVVAYLQGFNGTNLTTTADRVSIAFDATPRAIDEMFHTSIEKFAVDGVDYEAPRSAPELPARVNAVVAGVEGLSTYSQHEIHTASGRLSGPSQRPILPAHRTPIMPQGYLPPASYDGTQFEYAPDFQVAYDEQSLFQQYGYPTNATVATILWSGSYLGTAETACGSSLSDGHDVGPWVPADIYDFYNETFPSGEPHSALTAVPIDGAAGPGCLASYDTSGAVFENTLDLEMVGSTAPGAHIYNVYGPVPSEADLDQAFATILSPPTSLPPAVQSGLDNVTTISNSWGGSDTFDPSWNSSLAQAQARGLSVLASSGDSDDNAASSKYAGTTVEFPSSMAYDTYGTSAIGGTTVDLNPTTLQLESQVVWNISAADTGDGGPAGSTGGVSHVFAEPSWQLGTEANSVLHGAGRGVPDISGIANNTLLTITIDGIQYRATNASSGHPFYYAWGTSIASPLTAGMVAEIDHVLVSAGNPLLGFLNPVLYSVANHQYAVLPSNSTGIGAIPTGPYAYSLPTTPFFDVTAGSNYLYPAKSAYDLVTGWGSLDAYNYTMYVLEVSSAGVLGHLAGVQDRVDLTGLKVSSAGVSYNASTQQNFFLANSLGAPVYWVQNVVYISGQPGAWQMWFTGWVVFPFYAAYPSLTVYEYNVPSNTLDEATPVDFNFTTQLTSPGALGAQVEFSFGVAGTSTLTLPVPGASFLIGSLNYSYSWQGTTYTNGGPAFSPGEGFLSPQFGLVGGPSGGLGEFQPPTAGTLSAWVEPSGSGTYLPAATQTFGLSTTQTGEEASNLVFTQSSGNGWSITTTSGSQTQGVLCYELPYEVKFSESGLPTSTSWSVTLNGVEQSSTTSTIVFSETNGFLAYTLGDVAGWHQSTLPYHGIITVNDASLTEPTLVFTPVTYPVAFSESGLPSGARWYVNFTSGPTGFSLPKRSALAGAQISASLVNGTYGYSAATNDEDFGTTVGNHLTQSDGMPPSVTVTFYFAYDLTFSETGLPAGTSWSVALDGTLTGSTTSTITLSEPNATHSYAITDISGWHQATLPYTGSVKVQGSAVTEPTLVFAQVTYNVTFTQAGLPSGTEWWVNLTSGPSFNATARSLSFTESNGTYNFDVATSDKQYTPVSANGSFGVNGSLASESATFVPVTYSVTFRESGLPSGTSWSVTMGGTRVNSTTSTVTLNEPNGTHPYAITDIAGWHETTLAYAGSVTVTGAPVPEPTLVFTQVTYGVAFTEAGLPSGAKWWVNFTDGQSFNATSSTLTFSEPNGTYSYSAVARGYSNQTAALVVHGESPAPVAVSFASKSARAAGLPALDYVILGVVVAVAALGIAAVLVRRRRKAPPRIPVGATTSAPPPRF